MFSFCVNFTDQLWLNVGQLKPNLRCKRKVLSGLEGLLEIVSLRVMAESVRAGTHLESFRDQQRVTDSRSCNLSHSSNDLVLLDNYLNVTGTVPR